MIINCENCNKKFNLDSNLIGANGRVLQCSSCNHKWFFKLIKDNEENLRITNDDINITSINRNIKVKESKRIDNKIEKLQTRKSKNWLSIFIIFIITFVSLILVIDTFKYGFLVFFPNILSILDSLYQTLYDIQLFLKDLSS